MVYLLTFLFYTKIDHSNHCSAKNGIQMDMLYISSLAMIPSWSRSALAYGGGRPQFKPLRNFSSVSPLISKSWRY